MNRLHTFLLNLLFLPIVVAPTYFFLIRQPAPLDLTYAVPVALGGVLLALIWYDRLRSRHPKPVLRRDRPYRPPLSMRSIEAMSARIDRAELDPEPLPPVLEEAQHLYWYVVAAALLLLLLAGWPFLFIQKGNWPIFVQVMLLWLKLAFLVWISMLAGMLPNLILYPDRRKVVGTVVWVAVYVLVVRSL